MPWEDVSPQEISDLKKRYSAIPDSGWQDVQQTGGPVQQLGQRANQTLGEQADNVINTPSRAANLLHAGFSSAAGIGNEIPLIPDVHPVSGLVDKMYQAMYGGYLKPSDTFANIAGWAGREMAALGSGGAVTGSVRASKSVLDTILEQLTNSTKGTPVGGAVNAGVNALTGVKSAVAPITENVVNPGIIGGAADAGVQSVAGDQYAPYGGVATSLAVPVARGFMGGSTAAQNLPVFQRAGIEGDAGQISQNPLLKFLTNSSAYFPFSRGMAKDFADKQGAQLEASATQGLKKSSSPVAGAAIKNDLNSWLDKSSKDFAASNKVVVDAIPPNETFPVTNFANFLAAETSAQPGLDALIKTLKSPEIEKHYEALVKESIAGNGQTNIQGLLDLRSLVGGQITTGLLRDKNAGAYDQMYKALTENIRSAIQKKDMQNAGPTGLAPGERGPIEKEFDTRNAIWKDRNEKIQNYLGELINKPSATEVADSLVSSHTNSANGRGGEPDTLKAVKDSVSPQAFGIYVDHVLSSLGKPPAGMANPEVRDAFGRITPQEWNFNSFLTNWNKINPEAKNMLVPEGTSLRARYDDLANIAALRRDAAGPYANPSGTAQANVSAGTLQGAVNAGIKIVKGAGTVASNVTAGTLITPLVTTAITKGLAQNQKFISWLASSNNSSVEQAAIRLSKIMPSMSSQDRQDAQRVQAILVNQTAEQK